ncbi:MAG: hypothetical protein K2L17_07730 [Muribaculaceae bacterium]|nr:hypothetical protein [Muribaculaceae bacterium]
MVDLSKDAESILNSYLVKYAGYRTNGEKGISAFQNWYYQVSNYIINLDKIDINDGYNLSYQIPYWGSVIFTKVTLPYDTFILVTDFKFNEANFFQFIRYHRYSRNGQPIVVGNLNYNYKLITNQGSRLYGIMTPYDEILIRPYYDRIIPFHHCSENYNRMHAIGIKNGRCFAIYFDGNTEVLSMNASELSTIGCRHFHNLGESKKKSIRLTEAQFKRMLTECITKIINEIA